MRRPRGGGGVSAALSMIGVAMVARDFAGGDVNLLTFFIAASTVLLWGEVVGSWRLG